jgi:RNA polymerase sigma factor
LFGRFFSRNKPESVDTVIKKIRSGEKHARDDLINNYRPFILKCVSRTAGKYIEVENSEEYSVGLMAFNEAIDCFDDTKSAGFLSFAEQVIRNRLIDHIRRQHKSSCEYPFTYFENEENTGFEEKYLKKEEQFEHIEIKEEIELLEQKLGGFGLKFEDLVLHSPKHQDSKKLAIEIAHIIASNNQLFERMDKRKSIPMVDLMKFAEVSQRTIERNRVFIIAVTLILRSNLEVLQSYVTNAGEGRGKI